MSLEDALREWKIQTGQRELTLRSDTPAWAVGFKVDD